MAIQINLDEILKQRNLTSKELCDLVKITEANMSILRSGKAKAIRFSTLNRLCYYLDCAPGDILKYNKDMEDINED